MANAISDHSTLEHFKNLLFVIPGQCMTHLYRWIVLRDKICAIAHFDGSNATALGLALHVSRRVLYPISWLCYPCCLVYATSW